MIRPMVTIDLKGVVSIFGAFWKKLRPFGGFAHARSGLIFTEFVNKVSIVMRMKMICGRGGDFWSSSSCRQCGTVIVMVV